MIELPVVVETPTPTAAASGTQRKNRNRSERRGPSKRPNTKSSSDTKKKALIVGCVLLFLASAAALIIVTVFGDSKLPYNLPMKQFVGKITVRRMEDAFLEWNEEYADSTSASAKSLVSEISSHVLNGLKLEGVKINEFRLIGLSPSEPKSFSVVTQSIDADTLDTTEYEDFRFVTARFETYGIPSNNIPVIMASNGRWGEVADVIEARMASIGLKVQFDEIELEEDFIGNVQMAARADLSLLQVPPTAPPIVSGCDCEIDGRRIGSESMACQCDSPCFPAGDKELWGGLDNEFTLESPICLAAFYAGVIEGAGGAVEAIPIGKGQVVAGMAQNGIVPSELEYQTNLYMIKKYGPVIKPASDPISPLQALELQFEQGKNDEMLVIHLLYTEINRRKLTYSASLSNVQSSQTRMLVAKIKPKIISAIKGSGFSIGNIEVTRVIQPPEKKGVLFGFRIYSDDDNNAQVGAKLETDSPGKFARELASSIAKTEGSLRSVRYATGFLEKMKSSLTG